LVIAFGNKTLAIPGMVTGIMDVRNHEYRTIGLIIIGKPGMEPAGDD
jgi:hypothetical protein